MVAPFGLIWFMKSVVGEALTPSKGYHFIDGPYVEYLGRIPEDCGDATSLIPTINDKLQVLLRL